MHTVFTNIVEINVMLIDANPMSGDTHMLIHATAFCGILQMLNCQSVL